MALSTLWLQGESYSAAQDRALTFAMVDGKPRVLNVDDLVVTGPGSADPVWSVNVAAGGCVVRHNQSARLEALLIDMVESERWELDPPPPGEQANVFVGFGALLGAPASVTFARGELSRAVGPPGHNSWTGYPVGSVPLARVRMNGATSTVTVADLRPILPLNGVLVGASPSGSIADNAPEGALWVTPAT